MNQKKPEIAVSPRSEATMSEAQLLEIRQRRLSGDPRHERDAEIPLREPQKWYIKEANDYADANRHYKIAFKEGYEPVTIDDLPDGISPVSIGYNLAEDGKTLCRGERGRERLYKIPKAYRAQIEARKTALNKQGMGSAKAVQEDLANAAGQQFGSEAGDFAASSIRVLHGSDVETKV